MAKYDFNNSRYAKLWHSVEGRQILSAILADPELIRANITFAFQHFTIDTRETPTASDGTATFISRMKEPDKAYMMDMRAPLGDSIQSDKGNAAFYTGVIPDFIGRGTVEQAMERAYKEEMFLANFGNDAFLVSEFIDDIQKKIDGADMTLSNMAAQLLSKGHINYEAGLGIKAPVLRADIPTANFVKAGEKAWTDPDAQILTYMKRIEEEFRERTGTDFPMQWNIPYDMFHNVFLKNAEVVELVKAYRTVNDKVVLERMEITEAMFNEAIPQFEGISPIVVIKEKQRDVEGMVHGWEDGNVVLRPAGKAGVIRHTSILDQKMYEKYGAKAISRVFSKTRNGLYTIMNTTLDNGNLREWHTDLMMSAVPSLDEFLYHVVVDTKTANE